MKNILRTFAVALGLLLPLFLWRRLNVRMMASLTTSDMAHLKVDGKAACPRRTRPGLIATTRAG